MAEEFLHLDQINARLDQVRGIAVAKAVRGDLFFRPQVSMTRLSARCTPSRSSAVVALAAALGSGYRLGKSKVGLR
jgi:hypothetical protein